MTTDPPFPQSSDDIPFDRLSPGQIECLAYVAENYTSKEIARVLGVTSHAIDERMRHVIARLGVTSRREAARLFKESAHWPDYQSLIDQTSQVPPARDIALTPASPAVVGRQPAAMKGGEKLSAEGEGETSSLRWFGLRPPFPVERGQKNTLRLAERLLWIVVIAIFSALAFGAVASALQGISALFR